MPVSSPLDIFVSRLACNVSVYRFVLLQVCLENKGDSPV
jgi:hypothetical protein